jgi:hypothetical protein
MIESASLSLVIIVVFCLYNIILGASMLWLLRLTFIQMHWIQAYFRNVMILPLLIFTVIVSLIPYGVTPLLLNYFPTLEVSARTYELTQLGGTMLHLNFLAIVIFLLAHSFHFGREFMDSTSHLVNFFEMSLETFIKLLFVGVLSALLLVVDATVHPEVFKGTEGFAAWTALAVVGLLFVALELGHHISKRTSRA